MVKSKKEKEKRRKYYSLRPILDDLVDNMHH